jgi:glycosyltransferase involved in cell wall biosynthesis
MEKYKILMISDHALSTSGVGVQGRVLINGLLNTKKYKFTQLGAAVKHENHDVQVIDVPGCDPGDFIIKPVDGFGDRNMLRVLLATERPDVLLLFTDPRFFIWIWEMEDEIHQICPIAYNHLWDDAKFPPEYNKVLFESTDLINCINYPTYTFMKEWFPDKTNWTPHALPAEVFYPLSDEQSLQAKRQILRGKPDDEFVMLWVGRNARRKQPGDLLWAWKMFIDRIKAKYGHTKATLVMHTDPNDTEGPNLFSLVDLFRLQNNVAFSTERTSFDDMRSLYAASDCSINVSSAEGFGLPILESLYCARPIICKNTGGLTRQVVDYRDGSLNGVLLPTDYENLVGSQLVPYIVEQFTTSEHVADGIMQVYEMGHQKRRELGIKGMKYAHFEFSMKYLIEKWDETLEHTIKNWRNSYHSWSVKKF